MEYETAMAWINSRLKFNIRPGLERIEGLLALLNHPERRVAMIHVAGTNGKGSTVAFTRQILMAAGLKVGSFTSPAITGFNERISINRQPIDEASIIRYVEQMQPLVAQLDQDESTAGITEFELVTAMAFQYFAEQQVNVAVIEVGLGGLLDSTNVITPVVSGITTIGLDHVNILGGTLAEIAAQKAGIIKAGIPVVVGELPTEALQVVETVAQQQVAPIFRLGTEYQITDRSDGTFTFTNTDTSLPDLKTSLVGDYQKRNAAVAIELAWQFSQKQGLTLFPKTIQAGLLATEWPARLEKLADNPLTILDGAHNEQAMRELITYLREQFADCQITVVFAAIVTKDIMTMVQMLMAEPNIHLVLTTFADDRAMDLDHFATLALQGVELQPDWQKTVRRLRDNLSPKDVLIITGSLYFSAQVRPLFVN